MAFDAGMLAAVTWEISQIAAGAKIERICQPTKDQVVLFLHTQGNGTKKLLINAGSNNSRMGFTNEDMDNPAIPFMFCMLLRKHLTGAKLLAITQEGFERAVRFDLLARDEMGYDCTRYIYAEIMGKYSNLIFTDENKKVVSALKIVDFTTSSLRQILPGMKYELPPKQDKINPLECSMDTFLELFEKASPDCKADKFITANFMGISALVAREIAFVATGHIDTSLSCCSKEKLSEKFFLFIDMIKTHRYLPTIIKDAKNVPIEYCFMEIGQYGNSAVVSHFDNVSELLEIYFSTRDRESKIRQNASDIMHVLLNAENRITRKLTAQCEELVNCEKGAEYKNIGDLITANLYKIKYGDKAVTLTDYSECDENGEFLVRTIELSNRLSPAANAQLMYKKYNKSKTAKVELAKQIELGKEELEYIRSVSGSLSRAEKILDLEEIRAELALGGYMKKSKMVEKKKQKLKTEIQKFKTENGYIILCGRNNIQNDIVTYKMAVKTDVWFHVKGSHGSHTVMICEGREPLEVDYTQAAKIAAYYSDARNGANVAVDYTQVKNLKKPVGSKPGFVTYSTNYTAYVTPDKEEIDKLKI